MIPILIEWGKETNWFLFFFPPFLIWFLAGATLLGFPPVLRRLSSDRGFVQRAKFSLKRAFFYRWELLFTAISLTLLTYIYHILLVLGRNLLSIFPDTLASTLGFLLLLLVFLAKLGKIAQRPPTKSPLKSVKYIFWGVSNPFRDYPTYRVLDEVNNEKSRNKA